MAYPLYYVATTCTDQYLPHPPNYLGSAAYIAVPGYVLMGAWVVGHEYDHDAFRDYGWINDLVGLDVHSSLMVPYFSCNIGCHHDSTQSLMMRSTSQDSGLTSGTATKSSTIHLLVSLCGLPHSIAHP
ncbi:hypothetical protein DCAR_0831389 [Daucus carota subsp. sativus]|uniref:Uncharacterized protein n=1 Tax=Daucus carota subsp. sativus TaxID=79200 RepID=A0A175YN34_DAUCS|nr:hypothetical protein DCAR_0831389 [Daucus carota subsp. sativus]